jgi:hypothetical protein
MLLVKCFLMFVNKIMRDCILHNLYVMMIKKPVCEYCRWVSESNTCFFCLYRWVQDRPPPLRGVWGAGHLHVRLGVLEGKAK